MSHELECFILWIIAMNEPSQSYRYVLDTVNAVCQLMRYETKAYHSYNMPPLPVAPLSLIFEDIGAKEIYYYLYYN